MSDVPAIPPLSAIADTHTQRVLKPLVDGWNLRNSDGDKAFVTVEDIKSGVEMFRSGSGSTVKNGKATQVGNAKGAVASLLSETVSAPSDSNERISRIEADDWFRNRFNALYAKSSTSATSGNSTSPSGESSTLATSSHGDVSVVPPNSNIIRTLSLALEAGQTVFLTGRIGYHRDTNLLNSNQTGGFCGIHLFVSDGVTKTRLDNTVAAAGYLDFTAGHVMATFEATASLTYVFTIEANTFNLNGYYQSSLVPPTLNAVVCKA